VGDPCYDVLQHVLNCEDRLTADRLGPARRLADLLELDGDSVTPWLFARCVLESVGQPQLRHVAIALAPAALPL
jgi:streptomycin 6-kinase